MLSLMLLLLLLQCCRCRFLASRLDFLEVLFPLPTRATDILQPTAQDLPHVRPRNGRLDDDAPNPDFFKCCQACHDHLLPQTPQPTKLENYTGPPDCNTRLQVCNPSVMSEDVTDYTFSRRQVQHGVMHIEKSERDSLVGGGTGGAM
jgi:hypothetical protein